MISHYFTLKALCGELREDFLGAVLVEAYTQVKDEMSMTLETAGGGTRTFTICVGAGTDVVFLREGRSRAKRNSADIFPGIFGAEISGLGIDDFSRVVTVAAGPDRVKIHLFGSAVSNVFLVDGSDTVVSSLKRGRELTGRRYGTAKTGREVVSTDDADRLAEILVESGGSPVKALKAAFPWLGKLYANELMFRAGSAGSDRSGGPAPGGPDFPRALLEELDGMLRETGRPSPCHYAVDGHPSPLMSVVRLTHVPSPAPKYFSTVNEAVREAFFVRRNRSGFEEEKERLLAAATRDREKSARSLVQATSRAADVSAPDGYRKIGTLILTHLNRIRKGQTEVDLPGEQGGETVRVMLERSLTPAANANRYFDRARKAEKALEESRRRVSELSAKLEEIGVWIAELASCAGPADLRRINKNRAGRSSRGRVAIETPGGERLPFRVFAVGGHYEAW
ncbi:MAG TPA: NFACT family protein, partial [Bacteroidota bacterium]|nr:NFACT family protein [Bacteroidota bacterium]